MKKFFRISVTFVLLFAVVLTVGNLLMDNNGLVNDADEIKVAASPDSEGRLDKIHLNLDVNEEYLDLVNTQSEELSQGTENKFGGNGKNSSINVHFTDFKPFEVIEGRESYEGFTKGVIKTPDGNFNFNGEGLIYKVKLQNGEWIYSGSFEGGFKNKIKDETFTISIRYNSETEESDITFVSGLLGDTGILPFGQPFLFQEEIEEINNILSGEGDIQ